MSHDVRFIRGLLGIWMIKIEHKKSLQMTASHILILDHQKGHKFIQGHLWKSYLLQKKYNNYTYGITSKCMFVDV